jgi:hypothetical protein
MGHHQAILDSSYYPNYYEVLPNDGPCGRKQQKINVQFKDILNIRQTLFVFKCIFSVFYIKVVAL